MRVNLGLAFTCFGELKGKIITEFLFVSFCFVYKFTQCCTQYMIINMKKLRTFDI